MFLRNVRWNRRYNLAHIRSITELDSEQASAKNAVKCNLVFSNGDETIDYFYPETLDQHTGNIVAGTATLVQCWGDYENELVETFIDKHNVVAWLIDADSLCPIPITEEGILDFRGSVLAVLRPDGKLYCAKEDRVFDGEAELRDTVAKRIAKENREEISVPADPPA